MRTILIVSVLALAWGDDAWRTVALGIVFVVALVSVMRSANRTEQHDIVSVEPTPAATIKKNRTARLSDVEHAGRRRSRP